MGFGIDTCEYGTHDLLSTIHVSNSYGGSYNIQKTQNNEIKDGNNSYVFVFNNKNSSDNVINTYRNNEKLEMSILSGYNSALTEKKFVNYILYIGARANSGLYTKMNLASIRIYNRALSDKEIQYNYEKDKARFNLK